MNRADVQKLIDEQDDNLGYGPHSTYQRGRIDSLYLISERIKELPLGPDEWRVQPGAPNPHELPVEELPDDDRGEIRVWNSDPETVAAEFTLLPSEARETTFSAWRPAAVGPGGGA